MKKILWLCVFAILATALIPLNAKALSGEIFISKDITMTTTTEGGKAIEIDNNGESTRIYLGANVTEGSLTAIDAHIELKNSNFTFDSATKIPGWSGTIAASEEGNGIDIHLTNEGATGRKIAATISLEVTSNTPSTEKCEVVMTMLEEPAQETPTVTPKCKVENGVYYDANGNQVTEEAYKESCSTPTENPQTGSFLPYTIIVIGLAVAGGLYIVTKKNNKMFNV